MNIKIIHPLLLSVGLLSLLLSGSASAGGFGLPLGLEWCQDRTVAESKTKDSRAAADDVVESAERR
jgi:hypothetical protein